MNYLYNGVELPALPDWDKEKYPYAFIHENDGYWIEFRVMDVPFTRRENLGAPNGWLTTDGPYNYCNWKLREGKWAEETIEEWNSAGSSWGSSLIWANFDVRYKDDDDHEDGTLYLAASAPIPVGGEPIDPTSFMQGYIVGRRLAGMRK